MEGIVDKALAVVCGDKVSDITIQPGTTAADILTSVQLPGSYWLSKRDGQPFGENEVVYDLLRNGEKIYATPEASVAR